MSKRFLRSAGALLLLSTSVVSTLEANTAAGGSRHTVVVKPDGTVWTWGGNGNGQLGDGTTTDRRVAAALATITNATAVAAGSLHTLVLRSDGSVWAWGYNGYGQLGDGTITNRYEPVPVSGLSGVIAIAAGENHCVALTSDGRVWTWGRNTNGQLGDGSTNGATQPIVIGALTSITAIAAGTSHTLAVKSDGTAWAWGYNFNGQLGDGTTTQRTSPVQVSGITGATAVAAGSTHSLILKSDGTVSATGNNFYGQIGDNTTTQRTSPVTVTGLTNIAAIAAGQISSYGRKTDGSVWAWGSNGSGRLGDGTTTGRYTATQATALSSITLLAAGQEHAIAVTTTGVVWTWGHNGYGQLGDGTTESRSTPVAISDTNYGWKVGTPVFSVAAGTYTTEKTVVVTCATSGATIHYTVNGDTPTEADPVIVSGGSLVIDQSRTLKARAWKTGMPASELTTAAYTLTVASLTFSPTPTTYTMPQSVTIATTSPGSTIRYTTDGSTPTESSPAYAGPLQVGTTTTIKAIGFRTNWTASPLATGTYTMNFGTLAPPTFSPGTDTYTSEAVVTLTAMTGATIRYTINGAAVLASSPIYTGPITVTTTTTINAKAFHSDYTTSAQSTATFTIVVATPTLSPTAGTYAAGQVITVTTATAGATLTYTLTAATPTSTDPVVPASGLLVGNFTLKVGAFKTGCTPSGVATAIYAVSGSGTTPNVAAADSHSLAVRSDGTAWAWGANGSGQLGDGTSGGTGRTLPAIVGGITGAVAVSGGDGFSVALRSDGTVLAWGYNNSGRLGDGTQTNRVWPTSVTGLTGVVAIAAGSSHTLALKSDGSVWGWGVNGSGQIGLGNTNTPQLVAVQSSNLSNVTAIAAGWSSSIALKTDGTVWSFGANGNGQLGLGDTASRSTPTQIPGLTTVSRVAAGWSHALAVLGDGSVRSWGWNMYGQVGDASNYQRNSPVPISTLTNITAVAAGVNHSLALGSDGGVWAWGYNGAGQLGDGTTTNRNAPVAVQGLPTIVFIAAGGNHSLAIDVEGGVWAWGSNANGRLGDGTTTNRLTPVQIATAGMSWKVAAPVLSLASGVYNTDQSVTVTCTDPSATLHYTTTGSDPLQTDPIVASGGSLAIAQTLTLKVRAWKPGAVASEITTALYELKAITPTLSPASNFYGTAQSVTISTATSSATLRYTTDGTEPGTSSPLYSGAITVSDTRTVKARAFKTGWTASDSGAASYVIYAGTVATPTMTPAGGSFTNAPLVTLACTTSGATIRYTLDGSDPAGASPRYEYPFLIDRTTVVTARAFVPGFQSSATATATYSLDAAGQTALPSIVPGGGRFVSKQTITITGAAGATLRYSTNGIDPTATDTMIVSGSTLVVDRAQIVKVRAWLEGSTPSAVRRADFVITGAVAGGHQHSLALAADGQVWAWGRGTEGQLGDGGVTDRTTPVAVLAGAAAIAAGHDHSLAARADGTVWAWGSNGSGRLGDGTTTNRLSPVQAVGLTDVVAVAAGATHSLALKRDGTVWAWGSNADGELGDGTTNTRTSAVQVIGLTGISSIAAGQGFSLAVQGDGASGGFVWAWGRNAKGQLGDGSTLTRTVPVRVIGLSTAVQVAAGLEFGIARLVDGTIRAWGANEASQLGNLSGGFGTEAVVIPALQDVRHVAAGLRHGLAVDGDGRAWGWGENVYSQLGTQNYTYAAGTGAPHLLPGSSAGVGVAGGWQHTLVLRADGSVWATGRLAATGLGVSGADALTAIPGVSLASNSWLVTDGDGDGLQAWHEYLAGVDPLITDTNGNGLSDLVDLRRQSQSANPDDDGDGLPNVRELALGTDPFRTDTDGDGVSDLSDAFPLDAARSQPPAPTPGDTTPPTINLIYPASARPVGGGN